MSDDTNAKSSLPGFTDREMYLLAGALLCLKSGDLAVDYKKFADFGGFKNANSAKASWNGIKKKLEKITPASSGGETPGGVKRKKDGNDDDDEAVEGSPVKKTTARKKPTKKAVKTEAVDEDNEEDEY